MANTTPPVQQWILDKLFIAQDRTEIRFYLRILKTPWNENVSNVKVLSTMEAKGAHIHRIRKMVAISRTYRKEGAQTETMHV